MPRTGLSLARFSRNLQSLHHVSARQLLKFRWIFPREYGVIRIFKLRGGFPKFAALLAAKLCLGPQKFSRCKNSLEVLYHLAEFGGARSSDFTCRRGDQKSWVFCESICPSRFWTSEIVRSISPWMCWNAETIMIHWIGEGLHSCSTLSECCQLATSQNDEVQKTAKVGVFFHRQRAT